MYNFTLHLHLSVKFYSYFDIIYQESEKDA